jgi:hypothetical protein
MHIYIVHIHTHTNTCIYIRKHIHTDWIHFAFLRLILTIAYWGDTCENTYCIYIYV